MIPPDLESLLEPLERFEQIRQRAVRLGPSLCDLSYANPYEAAEVPARSVIREALDRERTLDLQYTPFGGQLLARRAIADSLRRSHGLPFAFSDMVLTPGAMAALQMGLRVTANVGDEVVIPSPCWIDYPLYARVLGLTPRLVPLEPPEFRLDAEAIRAAITAKTAGILFSHPANPTGRAYPREELSGLAAVMRDAAARTGRPLTLIADECHRDFVPTAYESAAASWPRTLIVYSFGKDHFIQGQRLGYIAVSPDHPEREAAGNELVRWTRITGFCTPTALMQRAVPGLLALHYDHEDVHRWRDRYIVKLSAAGYEVAPASSTLFLYVATPGGEDDFAFTERMARQGVLTLPAPIFHHTGYFRISLTGTTAMLETALAKLTTGIAS